MRFLVVGVVVRIGSVLGEEKGFFSPEEITALGTAFEDTLRALRLVDRNDPIALIVAKKIIALAKHGELNPARLRDIVINHFQEWSR
jgi:hypothetical protein